jgi:DNA ligase-1
MRQFAALYTALDATTANLAKHAALVAYFRAAPPADAAWAAYFLAGGRPHQIVPTRVLRDVACARARLPGWLFDECHDAVGDFAEAIAHVLPPPLRESEAGLATWVEQRLMPLRGAAPEHVEASLLNAWDELDWAGRFVLLKLISGGFRVGISRQSVVRALAEVAGLPPVRIAERIVGYTDAKRAPDAQRYLGLLGIAAPLHADGSNAAAHDAPDTGTPYPFFLAHPLDASPAAPSALGPASAWLAEWKWDGIRAQTWIWSRGEDLITERFPELVAAAAALPDGTVLDGEILAWLPGADGPLPFARLQPRVARKSLTRKALSDAPATFVAYDLLEAGGSDLRTLPLRERRSRLEALLAGGATPGLRLSAGVASDDWPALATLRQQSRERGVEGLMLKPLDAPYGVGRTRSAGATSAWWK